MKTESKQARREKRLHKRDRLVKRQLSTVRPIRLLRCVHEAGHACIAHVLGAGIIEVSVKPVLISEGHCRVKNMPVGEHEVLLLALAGDVATELFEIGGMTKLQNATDENQTALRKFNNRMSRLPATCRVDPSELLMKSDTCRIVEKLREIRADETDVLTPQFDLALNRTDILLRDNWSGVERLAIRLYFESEVSGQRAEAMLNVNNADADYVR